MRLADLDEQTRALLLETCSGREALAGVLLERVAAAVEARASRHTADAIAQAAERAVSAERDRVGAHLVMAELAGMPLALDAIRDGRGVTETFPAYEAAARQRAEGPNLRLIKNQETK